MKISELTIGQVMEVQALFGPISKQAVTPDTSPYVVGKNYFIRTVTHHYTGTLVEVHEHELVLTDAAWIADDGRFAQAIEKGEFSEVEPYPNSARVIIGRGAVLDAHQVAFSMPRSQK
jgi:hypothetical protein